MSNTPSKSTESSSTVKSADSKVHKNGSAEKPVTKASALAPAIQKSKSQPLTKAKSRPKPTSKSVATPKVTPGKPAAGPASEPSVVVNRAEDALDETGRKIGAFLGNLSLRIRKATAVAREEAEDIWAEAQSIRQSQIH